MAIAYGSAGAGGGTETSGASLDLACPASVAVNDILIAHVTHEGLTTAPTTPSGWTKLYGPAALGTGTAVAQAWVFGKLADGSEDGATIGFGTAGGTSGRYGRIYSFTGYSSGTLVELVGGFNDTQSEGSIPLPGAQTFVTGGLAVALLVQDDNNAFAAAGAVTGGTWAEPVAEFVSTTLGVAGCVVGIQTSTPTGNPGAISGGTANATADEGSSIGFFIHPSPMTGPHIHVFKSDVGTGSPKTVDVPDCAVGDKLYVIAAGNASATNTVTAASVSTTAGSTDSWVEEQESLSSTTAVWVGSYSTTVTGAGTITVSFSRTQASTQREWLYTVYRVKGSSTSGANFIAKHTNDATEVINATVAADSAVLFGSGMWDGASLPTGYTPTDALTTTVDIYGGGAYTHAAVYWLGETAGTRDYGTTGSTDTKIKGELIEVLAAGGDATVTATTIATTTALPAPVVQTGSTVAATVIVTTTALPKVVIPVVPPVIATTTALPAPTLHTGSTVAATAIVTTAALPAPTVQTGSTVIAATIATVSALPAPTVSTGSNATVAAVSIATVTTLPAPTVQTGSTVAGVTIATTVALPAPVVRTGSTVTPPTVATTAALPAPTVSVGSNATVTATSIVTVTALPAPVVQTGSTVSAVTITTVTAMPVPTVTVGGNATITAVTIATTVAMPAPSLSTGQRVNPPVVATTTALPAPTVSSNATVIAVTITTVVSMPVPTFHTGSTIAASVIATVAAMAAPFLPTQVTYGTGGASSGPVSSGQAGKGTAASGNAGSSLAGSGRAGRG